MYVLLVGATVLTVHHHHVLCVAGFFCGGVTAKGSARVARSIATTDPRMIHVNATLGTRQRGARCEVGNARGTWFWGATRNKESCVALTLPDFSTSPRHVKLPADTSPRPPTPHEAHDRSFVPSHCQPAQKRRAHGTHVFFCASSGTYAPHKRFPGSPAILPICSKK